MSGWEILGLVVLGWIVLSATAPLVGRAIGLKDKNEKRPNEHPSKSENGGTWPIF